MSKWTEEKIKKQIVVGNFLAYKGDVEIVKGGLETSSKLLETYNIVCDNSYKYVFNKAEDWQFFLDYDCTLEIDPEPIKVIKKVKLYRHLTDKGYPDKNWVNIEEDIYIPMHKSEKYFDRKGVRKHIKGIPYVLLDKLGMRTSVYIEAEIEVEE